MTSPTSSRPDSEGWTVGDLSIYGALRNLRTGGVQGTQEVRFPGQTNRNYKIACEDCAFFVKINRHVRATEMFEREWQSLKALRFAGAYTPGPQRLGDLPDGGSYLIMEWVEMEDFAVFEPAAQAALGRMVAGMHGNQPERHQFFGFGFPTTLGGFTFDNSFSDDWAEFFVETRLRTALLEAGRFFPLHTARAALPFAHHHAVEAICTKARATLEKLGPIRPSILHGDLCLGNAGAIRAGEVDEEPPQFRAVLHDPASFYGHAEFDLAFEGFPTGVNLATRQPLGDEFFDSYHAIIPRVQGHEERRHIYQLFLLLNHACATRDSSVLEHAYDMVSLVLHGPPTPP